LSSACSLSHVCIPQGLFPDEPLPKDGFIDLPDRPGFGVTLNRDKIHRPYVRSEEESAKNAVKNSKRPRTETPHMPF